LNIHAVPEKNKHIFYMLSGGYCSVIEHKFSLKGAWSAALFYNCKEGWRNSPAFTDIYLV